MNLIQSKWKERQSRVEKGIFFGNDEFIALRGSPSAGYTADPRASIASILLVRPDHWCDLNEFAACEAQHEDISIFGGATDWEAEGFIAVERGSQLLWLLHLSESEEFIQLSTDGSTIFARSSDGYPDGYEWRIPISSPQLLTVSRLDETKRNA